MTRELWVLIAAAGKPQLLGRTLASLARAEKPACYRGTIIVENGSRSGIETVARRFQRELRLHYRQIPEANKSHALNCALAEFENGLMLMTDDDVRLDRQVLMAYASAADGIDSGQFYGGPVLVEAEHGLPPAWLRRFYPQTIAESWTLPFDQPSFAPGHNFMGTNWAAFAGDLVAAGGFETRLGPGAATCAAGQETEAQRRLVRHGAKPVYVPGAIAWHYLHREFLDPAWVLRRAWRHGLEWGIRRTRDGQPATWPILRAAIGRLNAHVKGAVLRLLGGEERRFAAAFHEAKWRGRWEGLFLGRRWDELPRLAPRSTASATTESIRRAA
jgi:GT2 family glycosyltransferase